MSKYHVNTKTGNAGPCDAKKKCPFGDLESDHYDTPEFARAAYEVNQKTPPPVSKKTTPNPVPTFDELKNQVLPEDVEAAIDAVSRSLGSNREYSWDTLQGGNRTDKSIEKYENALRELVLNNPERMEEVNKMAAKRAANYVYARAYKSGVAIDPAVEKELEQMWNDPGFSFGEAKTTESIAKYEKLREGLASGRVTPAKIIGSGYRNPKRVAHEYVESQLEEYQEALNTRGRSNSINVSNALFRINEEKVAEDKRR